MTKYRRVFVTIELDTDADLRDLRDRWKWSLKRREAGVPCNMGTQILQVQVNVAKAAAKLRAIKK